MTPWTVAGQAPLSMGILQERTLKWDAIPSSRDLPNPRIKLGSPALQVDSLASESPRRLQVVLHLLPRACLVLISVHSVLPTVHILHSSSGGRGSERCCDPLVINTAFSDFSETCQASFSPSSYSQRCPGLEMLAPLETMGCNEGLTYQLPQGAPESSSAGQPGA